MKKISEKQILDAIIKEALSIKRKRELFKEAKKINEELKQLNEYGHPGAMLGWGFKNSESPSPVIGLSTQSPYEIETEETSDCCKLDQFPQLEKDIEEFGDEMNEKSDEITQIQQLKDENQELKDKLEQIQSALGGLNESFFDKASAAYKGIKSAVKTGAEAGKQQYQKSRQSQELENTKQKLVSALQKKMDELNKSGKQFHFQRDIQSILKPFGFQYKGKQIHPITEGEEPCDITQDELNEIFGKFGAMMGGAAKKVKTDIKDKVKSVKQYADQVHTAYKDSGKEYDQAKQQKAEKSKEILTTNSNMFNAVINAIKNYKPLTS